MVTGIKTDRGVLSVNQQVTRSDCNSSLGNDVPTFLEIAEQKGMSTGIVSTARITHATPAANYAHSVERDHEDDRDVTRLTDPKNCRDIASQLIEVSANIANSNGLEVALGGGRRSFLQRVDGADPETGDQGERLDGRDLTQEWLDALKPLGTDPNKDFLEKAPYLIAIFEKKYYPYSSSIGGAGTFNTLLTTLRFFLIMLSLNILILPFLLSGPFFPFVFYVMNGYLLGREYFELVALRRTRAVEVKTLRKKNMLTLFLTGLLLAFMLTIPVINLVTPIIATGMMVQLFEEFRNKA